MTDGARSAGPRTVTGKANSSHNALKHGLFSAQPLELHEITPRLVRMSAALEGLAAGRYEAAIHVEMACLAQRRLDGATKFVDQLRAELTGIFVAGGREVGRLAELLEQEVRVSRYQRRFRGQRDRALRALLKASLARPLIPEG